MGLAALETEHGDPLGAFDSVTLVISNCQICAFPCRTSAHVITYFAASKLDGSPSSSGECLGSALTCEGEGRLPTSGFVPWPPDGICGTRTGAGPPPRTASGAERSCGSRIGHTCESFCTD